jgi:hypothetical protein
VQHDASYPQEEPGAGNLHARIREGESRMAELLDHRLYDIALGLAYCRLCARRLIIFSAMK